MRLSETLVGSCHVGGEGAREAAFLILRCFSLRILSGRQRRKAPEYLCCTVKTVVFMSPHGAPRTWHHYLILAALV